MLTVVFPTWITKRRSS